MDERIDKLLSFELVAPIAQFRKFYSNISALSYEIPPRTVIAGILASILEKPRDSYYELFAPDNCKIGVQLITGIRKYMAYTNYRNPKERKTIQTRIELLLPKPEHYYIRYSIFFWHKDQEVFYRLYNRLKEGNMGYGVYMGQRQFRAMVQNVRLYKSSDLVWEENYEGSISTATFSENVIDLENVAGLDIISSSMPVHLQQVEDGREPLLMAEIVFETTGQGLKGQFKEVLELRNNHIAFMSLFAI